MKSHVGNIIIVLLIIAAAIVSITKLRSADALTAPPALQETAAVETTAADTSSLTVPTAVDMVATTTTTDVLSEFNKLSITGSCIVTRALNQKRCDIAVTYTSSSGVPVIDRPVTIATLDAQGTFTNFDNLRLVSKRQGGVVLKSANLGNGHEATTSFIIPADATSTLFIALTPDGLRAQSTFAETTTVL